MNVPAIQDGPVTVYQGDALPVLREMPAESVHCVVTSPPYWGLRDYDCVGQLGLESTPEEYVANMVALFREVRRVLRSDGACWLNLGDSYAGSWGAQSRGNETGEDKVRLEARSPLNARRISEGAYQMGQSGTGSVKRTPGLKPKDLVGIPWRVAFALQQPYYTGRIKAERDRVWMAATLDAEGTICGFRHVRPDGNVRTGVLVFITNSSERLLSEADRIWPGARYIEQTKRGDVRTFATATRDCWRWQIQRASERSQFLREIYLYLLEKRKQAIVAWNLLECTLAAFKLGRHGETAEVKARRDVLVGLLSDLNQGRGGDMPGWCKEPPSVVEPGWYLRSDVIWAKNNPMPESVSDRPTKAHEYVFLLTKSPRYFYDAEAVREDSAPSALARAGLIRNPSAKEREYVASGHWNGSPTNQPYGAGRNKRSVWTIATQPYPEAHFAIFPGDLVIPCIKAGTSERGCCPECGAPWRRAVERDNPSKWAADHVNILGFHNDGKTANPQSSKSLHRQKGGVYSTAVATGWEPTCQHSGPEPVPCTVLDPFAGSGTTLAVARRLGRRSIGIELQADYLPLIAKRIGQAALPLLEALA